MRTISPTYFVQPNGFSFNYKPHKDLASQSSSPSLFQPDETSAHFSMANSVDDPLLGEAAGRGIQCCVCWGEEWEKERGGEVGDRRLG